MEEKMLTMKQESEIKEKAQKIKEEKKLRKIYPMVVFGEAGDDKEVYVPICRSLLSLSSRSLWQLRRRMRLWQCARLPRIASSMVTVNSWITTRCSSSVLWVSSRSLSLLVRVRW